MESMLSSHDNHGHINFIYSNDFTSRLLKNAHWLQDLNGKEKVGGEHLRHTLWSLHKGGCVATVWQQMMEE